MESTNMKTKQIIDEASKIVSDDREKAYGNKKANHNNIAKLWSAYLDKDISPHDVAMLMTLLKVARTKFGQPTEDTYVDAAAYMAIAGECKHDNEESWVKGHKKWKKQNADTNL